MTEHSQEANLDINITLDPPPIKRAGFGTALLIAPAANNSTSMRSVVYRDADDVGDDWTQNEADAAEAYFGQNPEPDELMIGEVDLAGGETYVEALNAIIQYDSDFYAVAIDSRTDTDQEAVSDEIESHSKPMLGFFQSSEQDIVTGSLPGSTNFTTSYDTRERSLGVYHTDDSEWLDMAWMARVLAFDQDRQNPPFFAGVSGVNDYGALPAGADIGSQQAPGYVRDNNWNHIGEFGPAPAWLAPGQNFAGRQGKVLISRDWFEARLQEDVSEFIVELRRDGQGLAVGESGTSETRGQQKMAGLVEGRYLQGVDAGHFLPEQIDIQYPTVLSSDVANGIIPLEGSITVLIAGQAVTFDLNFTRDPVT
jgi:hypothetical protein